MKTDRSILKKSATMLVLIVSAAFLLEACAKEPSPLEGAGMITMTTKALKVGLIVAGDKDVIIDWGDGKKSNVKDAISDEVSDWLRFTHDYSGATAHNIVVTGNVRLLYCSRIELTALDVSRNIALTDLDCSRNQLTALDISKNTMLLSLNCNHNQITRLNVSKNTVLTSLYIIGNQLTAAALNDLFRSLPDNTKTNDAIILIAGSRSGNPGNLECDQSIARKKGWGFIVNIRE